MKSLLPRYLFVHAKLSYTSALPFWTCMYMQNSRVIRVNFPAMSTHDYIVVFIAACRVIWITDLSSGRRAPSARMAFLL